MDNNYKKYKSKEQIEAIQWFKHGDSPSVKPINECIIYSGQFANADGTNPANRVTVLLGKGQKEITRSGKGLCLKCGKHVDEHGFLDRHKDVRYGGTICPGDYIYITIRTKFEHDNDQTGKISCLSKELFEELYELDVS